MMYPINIKFEYEGRVHYVSYYMDIEDAMDKDYVKHVVLKNNPGIKEENFKLIEVKRG